jgi:hypothetical protein
MQPKVCLVLNSLGFFNRAWTQILRNLGIDYTLCVASSTNTSSTIQTPQGVFAANSADLRNYFRQFDAVILCDNRPDITPSTMINYSVFWLSWNDPEDPAFLFFNPHFSTAITESAYNSNFPSDFPIVRPSPSDIAGTLYAADGGSAGSTTPLSAALTSARGACVLFVAENIRAYVMTVCNANSNIPYFWRLNTSNHSTLANTNYTHRVARNGRAGEILAVPAPPISSEDTETYPSDCVVAYRYRNSFWLPAALHRRQDIADDRNPYLFWLLYGLQLAGVRPRYKLPVQLETDHPLQAFSASAPFNHDTVTQMSILEASWDWMRDFARRKNTAIVNGLVVGTKYRSTNAAYHWNLLYSTSRTQAERDAAMRVHQILVGGHREGTTPCGVHDHTIGTNGYWGGSTAAGFVRHSGMRYGAPNDVPIERGRCCVAPHVLPAGVAPPNAIRVQVGDTELVEWEYTTSGTGTTFDLPAGSVHAARIIIESEIEEMLALGFPDGYCGGHKYTNTASNNSGGECYWQALKEFGFRGVRSASACNADLNTKRVPPNRLWHGFHLVKEMPLDIYSTAGASFSWGLFHPSAPSGGDAVRYLSLDHSNDISSGWTTNPALAWRAYRRVLCMLTGRWLAATAVTLGAAYFHPIHCLMSVSPSRVLERFDGWNILNAANQPHYNHAVELLENMDAVVRLLPEYLYWGTITDVMDHRERVMG